jgi:hypothetical protein
MLAQIQLHGSFPSSQKIDSSHRAQPWNLVAGLNRTPRCCLQYSLLGQTCAEAAHRPLIRNRVRPLWERSPVLSRLIGLVWNWHYSGWASLCLSCVRNAPYASSAAALTLYAKLCETLSRRHHISSQIVLTSSRHMSELRMVVPLRGS